MRARAAFCAAVLLTVLRRPAAAAPAPPARALILIASRDFRRAAAFGWMAPVLAARSRALIASARETCGSSPSAGAVAMLNAVLTAVLAAERRGPSTASRRSALRTRFRPDGLRAPVHFRGV